MLLNTVITTTQATKNCIYKDVRIFLILVNNQAALKMYWLEPLFINTHGKVFWISLSLFVLAIAVILKRFLKNDEFEKIPGPSGPFLINNTLDFLSGPGIIR